MKKIFQNRSGVKKFFVAPSIVKQVGSGDKLLKSGIRKALLSTLLLSPALVQALGLGTLTTNSALNEPFDARIQLLNTTSEELQTITVELGGVEQFKNAGIERPFLLSSLEFVIVEDSVGNYLHITSQESIKEPFLNFLLEVNWAKGRLVREYTALLDPPVFDTSSRIVDTAEVPVSEPIAVSEHVYEEPVQMQEQVMNIKIEQLPDATLVSDEEVRAGAVEEYSSTISNAEAVSVTEQVPHEEAPVTSEERFQQQPQSFAPSGVSLTTSRGDTLWSIAKKNRPDRSVSIQQMMLSLLNTNPNAFVNNNINVLKTGQVLRIPDKSEITQLSKREAISLVKEHNALWDDYRQGLAASVALRPTGAVSSAGTVVNEVVYEEVYEEPEVRLLTATDESTVAEEVGVGTNDDSESNGTSLENELALVTEQLVSGNSENVELKDRLKESEEIVGLLKQQVALQNQELAALQLQLRKADLVEAESKNISPETQDPISKEAEAEEAVTEVEKDTEIKVVEEKIPEENIEDILTELEEEEVSESETVYLEHGETSGSEDPSLNYEEYDAPAENLSGKEVDTQYLTQDEPGSTVSENQPQNASHELSKEEPVAAVIDAVEVDESQKETGLLDRVKGMLPAGLTDSIPGGINTVIAVVLGLLGLFLLGFFKIIGRGNKGDAEVLDLLDPEELDDTEAVFDTVLEDASEDIVPDDILDQETVEVASDSFEEKVAEEFDLDFNEEVPDLMDEDIGFEEHETTEGLVNLEDTLDQIKPLLEQTEEDLDDDPLEEVNLSLAYEQFDKAEMLVNKAIEDHPEEDGYKLRLLEVYYAANNKDSYEVAAKSLFEVTDGEGHLWESAVAMWTEMSPERELFEDASSDEFETTIDSLDSEEDGVFDISSDAKGVIAGMSAAGAVAAVMDAESDDELINIADEAMPLEDTDMIDISGDVETSGDDFLNIAETGESEQDFLNITEEVADSSLSLEETQTEAENDFSIAVDSDTTMNLEGDDLDIEIDDAEDDTLTIDMLDITAAGSVEDTADIVENADAEELFELTNEFKSVDKNVLSATSVESEESAEILEFSSDETLDKGQDIDSIVNSGISDTEDTLLDGDDDLESLAKSLEDTISGLDAGGLDDLTFEFDPDGTLESTLTSTLGASTDLDLENEGDEIDTKLNLAKAYIELGDSDGAKDILSEVSSEGSEDQKKDAQDLLQQIT